MSALTPHPPQPPENGPENGRPAADSSTGDVFLVLGLPQQFLFGCDTMAITIPESQETLNFFGLRDLSSGAHFAWVSPPGAISRQGCWFVSTPAAAVVHVKQWDRHKEVLDHCTSQFEARSLVAKIDTLRPKLLSADTRASGFWQRLTACITEPLLCRVTGRPAAGHLAGHPAGRPVDWPLTTADTASGETAVLETRNATQTAEFVFLFSYCDIDPYRLLASAAHSAAPDPTERIALLLDDATSTYTEADLLGELQFVFLTGTLLSNLSCLEQWWHLVCKVYLRARHLVACRPRFCCSLIQTLHAQFLYLDRHVVGGFSPNQQDATTGGEDGSIGILDVTPHGAARLQASLAAYKRLINKVLRELDSTRSPDHVAVGEAFAKLEAWLGQSGWDLCDDYTEGPVEDESDQDDGDQPVLVELDENGREVGLVSWD